MTNEVQLFGNTLFGNIRTITIKGEPYFIANDITKALGYSNSRDALSRHCKGVAKHDIPTKGGIQYMNTITESDVYRLVIGSKLPSAVKFEKWVFEEVLPTIRKTGGYVSDMDMFVDKMFYDLPEDAKMFMKQAFIQRTKDIEKLKEQELLIEEQAPKVQFADAIAGAETNISIGELAKVLHQNGFKTGQNRLFKWLRQNGYIMNTINRQTNRTPTQVSIDLGVLAIKETNVSIGATGKKRTIIDRSTRVTPKGQKYFINKLCKI